MTRYAGLITRLVSYALLAEWESFPCYGAVAVGPVFVSGASRSSCLGGAKRMSDGGCAPSGCIGAESPLRVYGAKSPEATVLMHSV